MIGEGRSSTTDKNNKGCSKFTGNANIKPIYSDNPKLVYIYIYIYIKRQQKRRVPSKFANLYIPNLN